MAIGMFIDGAHLSICWKKVASDQQLDFAKMLARIEAELHDRVCEAYCFDATVSGCTNDYFKAMQRSGIRVKLYEFAFEPIYDSQRCPIIDRTTGLQAQRRIQKGVDVGLAVQLLDSHRRRSWDKLVLAAADADFAEPIQRLVEHYNVELTTLGLPDRTSHTLLPYAMRRLDLRALAPDIMRHPLQALPISLKA